MNKSKIFSKEIHRHRIEDHKIGRLANPWKAGILNMMDKEQCLQAWIEQIGDAELYEKRWKELDKNGD